MLYFRYNSSLKLTVAAFVIALTSACSDSSTSTAETLDQSAGGSDTTAGDNNNAGGGGTPANAGDSDSDSDSDSDNTDGATGQFDLSKYFFHNNVLSNNGQIDFVEKLFSQMDISSGSVFDLNRAFVNNNGVIEEYSSGKLIKTFEIEATRINETFLAPSDFRTSVRYANVGDQYMDANSTPPADSPFPFVQNASCVLEEHLATFDLSTATAGTTLASGVYNDVIRVQCITGFVSGTTMSPHSTLTSYMAKGIGVIFNEGNVLLFDDVYIVEEY